MGNRPCLKAAFLLAAGILLAWRFHIEIRSLFWSACVLTGLAFATYGRNAIARLRIGQVLTAAAFILAGAFRYSYETRLLPPDHISRSVIPSRRGPRVLIKGTLIADPAQKPNRTEIIIEADSLGICAPLSPARGKVLIPLKGLKDCPLRYGDRVLATGVLTSPAGPGNPGGFDYREWLARQGIHAVLRSGSMDRILLIRRGCGNAFFRNFVYPVRRFALAFMDSTVRDENARSLVRALTLGDQGMIPQEVRDDFSRTGAVHILSVSGSHVGFMYLILSVLFGSMRFPAGLNAAATAAGLVFYALLTEASAPVVRATIMALALLAGSRMERKTDPYNTLGFAGLCILSWKPQNLFDVGFQLSFLSVFSIAYVYERLKTLFPRSASCQKARAPAWMNTLIAAGTVSIAAQIGTAPVTAYYFNWIPLVSVPANIIAVPLSGLIMAVSFTGLVIAPLHFGTASVYGALNGTLLAVFIKALDAIEKIPCSCLTVPSPSAVELVLLYGMVLLILNLRNARTAGKRTVGDSSFGQSRPVDACRAKPVRPVEMDPVRRRTGRCGPVPDAAGKNPADRRGPENGDFRLRRKNHSSLPAPEWHPETGRHGHHPFARRPCRRSRGHHPPISKSGKSSSPRVRTLPRPFPGCSNPPARNASRSGSCGHATAFRFSGR